MSTICDRSSCTGCGLCSSLCPVSCISMEPGKLGHLFPLIDERKCLKCGLCTKNCPALNTSERHSPQHAFAAWSRDESDYRSSTSGGVSSVLSHYTIDHGGVVYGCAVLPGANIEHIRIDKKEDLYRIKGSKYVQSSITKVLPMIKQDVQNRNLVLFLGTPCQVAAVKKLFKFNPDNLILVDIVCHGTPSQKMLQRYLRRHVSINIVDDVKFRTEGGFIINALSQKHILYSSPELWRNRYKDYYYNAFMDGFSYRDSCYECQYASSERVSDITIGDFWGLGKEYSSDEIPEHRYGVSLVLPNTDKGQTLFQAITKDLNVYERTVSEAVKGNDQLRHPKEKTKRVIAYRFLQPLLGDKGAYDIIMGLVKIKMRLIK